VHPGDCRRSRNGTSAHSSFAGLLLATGAQTEALALAEKALANQDKALGRQHFWTRDSVRVTANALDALGRTEEAKVLREKYGVASCGEAKPSAEEQVASQ
jgi:hypothetical protein